MVFKLIKKVNRLKRQNDALKRKLEGGYRNTRSTDKQLSLQDIAVINNYFPIDANEANKNKKIDVVENMLGKKDQEFFQNAVIFFKSKGGSDCRKLIFNCMIAAITNEVANQYSFIGSKAPRKSFKDLRLCTCLYQAVKLAFPNANDDDIKVEKVQKGRHSSQ
ncbi:uncharacterized protein LOC116417460 [Nasonia vitripennis]|uniref:DUF4806 domain-containing protein n=1 Tax=Nasonia vitripennis TaxID=7425 RepID=A0A7M7QJD7_NASVI|nr:uncharacterized protein LOC116417460 [Nasonia vitripennis]